MANSDFKKNYTKRALIDGVLLLANAIQKLNYGRRQLMKPQLNTICRRLCSRPNLVTAELFGDDFPKAVISDAKRLSSKL